MKLLLTLILLGAGVHHWQSVREAQTLASEDVGEAGVYRACARGRKPAGVAFAMHMEAAAGRSADGGRLLTVRNSRGLPADVSVFDGQCEVMGRLEGGAEVRLVADVPLSGELEVTLWLEMVR